MRAWILPSAITLILGISSPAYGSDYEDSLLIKRLMTLSRSEKLNIMDSLLGADFEHGTRILGSIRLKESFTLEHYQKIWLERFVNADMKSKPLVIDSMFADRSINYDLIGDILSTDKYKHFFPSDTAYMAYRTELALKTGREYQHPDAGKVLSEYYNSGKRSRSFDRPTLPSLQLDNSESLVGIEDSNGVKWAVVNLKYYPDSRFNLWLARKEPFSDDWQGPWFTGLYGQITQDEIFSSLRFFNNRPYLRNIKNHIYYLVSPNYLAKDRDGDGLYDVEELAFGTDPRNYDTDGDGLKDGMDINPLAAGVNGPGNRDLAVRAAIKLSAYHNNPVNIYILKGDINPEMEYFTNSPNAMFLTDKSNWTAWQIRDKSGGIPIIVSVINESDSYMKILVRALTGRNQEESNLYGLENCSGQWIVICHGTECPLK